MTQEEKQLLLKDLCARLPYGVKAKIIDEDVLSYDSEIGVIIGKEHVDNEIFVLQCKNDGYCLTAISEFVPYLRPMSSMTKEEKEELKDIIFFGYSFDDYDKFTHRGVEVVELEWDDWDRIEFDFKDYCMLENWLNSHHFDYRGLIEKGLALEAPEGMYEF